MTNVDLIKKGYSLFAEGNVPCVLELFSPEIEWIECTGMPFIEDNGIYHGHEEIVAKVFMNLPIHFDGFRIEVNDIFGADDRVVMEGYYCGTNKATGHPFKANATHVWTIKNDKAIRFFQAVDTATIAK